MSGTTDLRTTWYFKRKIKPSQDSCVKENTAAYLWFITPVNIELSLKALQGEAKTSSTSLCRSLNDLLASLPKLPQTLALTETHLGLKE